MTTTAEGDAEEIGSAGEDRALMARVQGGDEGAFATLMERWERPVKSVIARIVLNASEAEELAQETFVRVWQRRESFRAGAEFRPWVFAVAVNLARNRLRWWRRRPSVSLQDWTETIGDGERGRGGVGEGMERDEQAGAVREAIVLFEYEQMSHIEIGVTVGATPKAVETRIHRAREKLRVALKRWV